MSHRRRSAAACNTFAKDTRIRSFALVQPLVMTIAALSTDQHDLQQQYTPLITPRLLPERSRVIPRTSNSSSCFSYRTSTCETKCSSSSAVVAYTRGYLYQVYRRRATGYCLCCPFHHFAKKDREFKLFIIKRMHNRIPCCLFFSYQYISWYNRRPVILDVSRPLPAI